MQHNTTQTASPPSRAVATLQGNQLRQLVAESLKSYLSLFRQHVATTKKQQQQPPTAGGLVPPLDPHGAVARWAVPAVFEMELVVESGAHV